uniref:Uncharacterized protein n=1 Tax=Arundo donax TaxID=35708 RepID=A0A0A8ZD18_ARUDO
MGEMVGCGWVLRCRRGSGWSDDDATDELGVGGTHWKETVGILC